MLSASRRTSGSASGANVEVALVADLLDLLVQPARARLAAGGVRGRQAPARGDDAPWGCDARTAYFDLVAAGESLERIVLVRDLTQAAAELARRQAAAGNLGERDVALYEAEEAQATIDLTQAQVAAFGARERFLVLLGLSPDGPAWSVARHLPALPGAEPDLADLERQALAEPARPRRPASGSISSAGRWR